MTKFEKLIVPVQSPWANLRVQTDFRVYILRHIFGHGQLLQKSLREVKETL